MKKNTVLLIAALLLPTLVSAQLKKDTRVNMSQALTRPTNLENMVGLLGLDPNKFSMSHSYSLSFSSFGGHSMTQGLYLNTMQYQLSSPLTMYLQLGLLHRPFADMGQEQFGKAQFFVSGAGLEYQPSDNFKVQVEFSQQPGSLYYSPYGRRSLLARPWWQKQDDFKEDN